MILLDLLIILASETESPRGNLSKLLARLRDGFCQVGHCKAFAMSQPDSSRARAKSIGHYILGLGDMGEYSK